MADGPVSTVIGVTSLAGDEISCALMTVEGLTLFAAVFKTGAEPEVRRAVPPFDRPGFARGLMADVRTIFVQPPAETCFTENWRTIPRFAAPPLLMAK